MGDEGKHGDARYALNKAHKAHISTPTIMRKREEPLGGNITTTASVNYNL